MTFDGVRRHEVEDQAIFGLKDCEDTNHRGVVPSSYLWFVVCPRIEQQHTRRREVFGVPGHDV